MKYDFSDIIADFVLEADEDLPSRLEYQSEALREAGCEDPALGRWVDLNEVNLLLSALDLDDRAFSDRFPAMTHLDGHERRRIAAALETHFEQCAHCSLKRGYDIEMDGRIEHAFGENRGLLLQILGEEDESESSEEGEHGGTEITSTVETSM
jgi:hypothetical protein